MDIETMVGALSAEERDELLERLSAVSETSDSKGDAHDAFACCGGARPMQRRRAAMAETRHMCCGAS